MAGHRGSCLCGEVAYEVDGPLEHAHHCHCSYCRKFHGTPYATYAMARPRGAACCAASGASRATSRRRASTAASARAAVRRCRAIRSSSRRSSRSATSTATRAFARRSTCSPRRRRRGGRSAMGCPRSTRSRPASTRRSRPTSRRATRPARRAGAACAARSRSGSRASRPRAQLSLRALPQGARAPRTRRTARPDRRPALHARRGRARGIQDPGGEVLHAGVLPDLRLEGAAHRPRPRLRDRADGRARRRSRHPPAASTSSSDRRRPGTRSTTTCRATTRAAPIPRLVSRPNQSAAHGRRRFCGIRGRPTPGRWLPARAPRSVGARTQGVSPVRISRTRLALVLAADSRSC